MSEQRNQPARSTEHLHITSSGHVRIAVDTGGTFTDIVVLDEQTGRFSIGKVATTPENVLDGVINATERAHVDLAQIERFFVYGSTTALNALLERKGVMTAYLGTEGFRDVPEIGRVNRPDMYNPKYRKPAQLVPRDLRFDVIERINARGEIIVPLDEKQIHRIATKIAERGVRAVAVCFLHAYRNPVHELRVKALLRELLPGVSVTLSSLIAPEQGEYERATTTILNAYLSPAVECALETLEGTLKQRGFRQEIVLTKSDGGGATAAAAKAAAINLLLSGPAGGVIGGEYIAEVTDCKNLITADVGGTSFDVSVIRHGYATANQRLLVAGFPVLIPNIDIKTIGAGGGSIAWVDAAGALHVGPQSAGAAPGPMCYGRGGAEPTVTDAAVANGYIDPKYFLGGEMLIDGTLAARGIAEKVARPLKVDVTSAATGILKIALSYMVGAVRDILAESGLDPREFALLCYGGGGPLFAAALLDELQVRTAIVPVAPANFSAWGMLMIDLRHDLVRAVGQRLANSMVVELRETVAALESEARERLAREGIAYTDQRVSVRLDMRYEGQGHTVTVPVDSAALEERYIYTSFEAIHRETYGYALELSAEVVNARCKAIGGIAKPRLQEMKSGGDGESPAVKGLRRVTDMIDGVAREHIVYERRLLRPGYRVTGPAIIEEPTTTTPLRASQVGVIDRFGNLVIGKREKGE